MNFFSLIFPILLLTSSIFALENEPTDALLPRLDPKIATQFYDLLKEVDEVLVENEIDYWATCGTLLGAFRHQGMIPWDDDIDLAIWEKDLGKLLLLKKAFQAKGLTLYPLNDYLKVYSEMGEVIYKEDGSPYPWKYPFIDFFPMALCEDKVTYLSLRLRGSLGKKEWFGPEAFSSTLKRIPFGPFDIPVPENIHEYLKNAYGEDYFEIAYADYDHSLEKKREKIKVKLVDYSPAPYLKGISN